MTDITARPPSEPAAKVRRARRNRGLIIAGLAGLAVAVLTGQGLAALNAGSAATRAGVAADAAARADAGIRQIQVDTNGRVRDLQQQSSDLNNQIRVLEEQLGAANGSVGSLVMSIAQLSSALDADIRQLEARGVKPALGRTVPSAPAAKARTSPPTPATTTPHLPAVRPPPPATTTTRPCNLTLLNLCVVRGGAA